MGAAVLLVRQYQGRRTRFRTPILYRPAPTTGNTPGRLNGNPRRNISTTATQDQARHIIGT